MDDIKINPIILEKLNKKEMSMSLRKFLLEILNYEKGSLDKEKPHYQTFYINLLNRFTITKSDFDVNS